MRYKARSKPLRDGLKYLGYAGMETDLIFTQGIELTGFASFPLLETSEGRARLLSYGRDQVDVATRYGMGAVVETPTWMANADRGGALGYDTADLERLSAQGVVLMAGLREAAQTHVVISANIGPRRDAYRPGETQSVADARAYHAPQIRACAAAGADLISGFTLNCVHEAAGIALAADDAGTPSVIAFTVETDGRLADGTSLATAITLCDEKTRSTPAWYMVNCAHPEHIAPALVSGGAWRVRLAGIVANASRCSHAELDNAGELDAGDPSELAGALAAMGRALPDLRVFGGCCGTDMRHLREIAAAISEL